MRNDRLLTFSPQRGGMQCSGIGEEHVATALCVPVSLE